MISNLTKKERIAIFSVYEDENELYSSMILTFRPFLSYIWKLSLLEATKYNIKWELTNDLVAINNRTDNEERTCAICESVNVSPQTFAPEHLLSGQLLPGYLLPRHLLPR